MNQYKFVKYINAIKAADKLQKDVDKLMRTAKDNIENDFMNGASLMINHEWIVVELLEEIMEDEYDTISWWIYETEFGTKQPNIYERDTGKLLHCLDTPEKLYNYLEEIRGMEA